MKALKYLAVSIAGLVIALTGIGFLLPSTIRMERSIEIQAPPASVYPVLNSFKRFQDWSPWKKYDPNAVITFSGPDAGVGAKQSWTSPQTGDGSQEIVETRVNENVRIKLWFSNGGPNDVYIATYTLTPVGEGTTRLVWSFDADYGFNLMGRYFGLMTDGMLGPDYEEGLANLKALVEGIPNVDFSRLNPEVVEVPERVLVYVSGRTGTDAAAITTALAVAYSKLNAYVHANGLQPVGPPLSVARRWDEKNKIYEYDAGIPVAAARAGDAGEIKVGKTYGGKAIRVTQAGGQDSAALYEALYAYAPSYGYAINGVSWEEYPGERDPPTAARVTHVYLPVK